MKKILFVFTFIGGVIIGGYFLNPVINDVRADNFDNSEEYYYGGHCGEYYEGFLDRFLTEDLTLEQSNLITLKFEELLTLYEITEEELYYDMDITHDIMIEMLEYIEDLGIDYYDGYHRGHMYR